MEIQRRTSRSTGWSPAIWKPATATRWCCCTAVSSAPAPSSAGNATSPRSPQQYRVLAPDQLGFGQSAKVIDFVDGRGMRIRHVARFCAVLGVEFGALRRQLDGRHQPAHRRHVGGAAAAGPQLVIICGGGEIQHNQHMEALYDYDATLPAMRRIVEALFYDASYPADDDYVRRRYESSTAPGAWEAFAAARFRRPVPHRRRRRRASEPTSASLCRHWSSRVGDKLLPAGWAAQIAKQIDGRSAVVDKAGHCPQIEQPADTNALILEFLSDVDGGQRS